MFPGLRKSGGVFKNPIVLELFRHSAQGLGFPGFSIVGFTVFSGFRALRFRVLVLTSCCTPGWRDKTQVLPA